MRQNPYRYDNNLENRIVYHTEKEFIRDILFLAGIIMIGVVTAITGLIAILIQISPDL